jgi:hypothetical protein
VKIRIILIALFFQCVVAQENASRPNDIVERLSQAWNQFDYAKSTELLNLALGAIERYSVNQQIEIYKFAAFIAFQNNNRTLATNYFMSMLNTDPTFTLDPVTTPPKILTLFQKTKITFLEEMQEKLSALQRQRALSQPSLTFLVPGLEQWQNGHKIKGALLSSSTVMAFGGLVYSYYDARQKKQDYADENESNKIPVLYYAYNSSYKRQFYFAYALAGIWAISQIDLHLWGRPINLQPVAGLSHKHSRFSVRLSFQF